MCDERTERNIDNFRKLQGEFTHRDFAKISAAAGLTAMLPRLADAVEVTGTEVQVGTPDGTVDCYFVHPASGN